MIEHPEGNMNIATGACRAGQGRWLRPAMAVALALLALAAWSSELPFLYPEPVLPVPYQARIAPGGALELSLGEQKYLLESDFAMVPGWASFSNAEAVNFQRTQGAAETFTAVTATFAVTRTVRRADEALVVTDTIRNLTDANLPMMYRHKIKPGDVKEYRICGYRIYSKRGSGTNSINASVICMPQSGGSLGLLALSDVFRAHFRGFAAQGYYGIGDDNLVIRPGASQDMTFAVFPSEKDGYYDQINAMRRLLGVNYVIPGGYAFLAPYPPGVITFHPDHDRIGSEDRVETIAAWLQCKNADFVGDGAIKSLGEWSHGTAWMKSARPELHTAFHQKVRQARPGVSIFHYFHCFLDVKSQMTGTYDDARILTPSGQQADYRNPDLPLFLPVEGSAWAAMQETRLARLRDEYQVDGIFWDEFPYSATEYHFGEPWDGVSGDIHPRTHEITRLKSSVALVTLPWRLRMLEMLAKYNLKLIANGGGGYTKTMTDAFARHNFLAFMETGSVTNLNAGHLSTPIGLGDHITERNELDCYRNMVRFLEFGSLYYYYHQQVEPFTHPTLTSYMFPITPKRLGEGFIFGEERILTNRSGYYSFGGMEAAELHFFDANGFAVKREAFSLEKDGRRFYRVDLAENETCAIVKR